MRRPRRKLEVNTFPFLAVLLCAMGSLILLLMAMDRRAKIAAQNKAREELLAQKALVETARSTAHDDAQKAAEADWLGRKAELEKRLQAEHDAVARQLVELLADLSRAEDDLRGQAALAEMLARRRAEANGNVEARKADLRSQQALLDTAQGQEKGELRAREQLTRKLLDLEAALKAVQARKAQEKPVFSLIPYKGKHGAGRKPVYVEVGRDAIVFHPGGARLSEAEWSSANLRRLVEERTGALPKEPERPTFDQPAPEGPYLLFLVRPDGIVTYYHALQALRGYRLDFGYELVEADWKFDFAPGELDQQPWRSAAKLDVLPSQVTRPPPQGLKTRPGPPGVSGAYPGVPGPEPRVSLGTIEPDISGGIGVPTRSAGGPPALGVSLAAPGVGAAVSGVPANPPRGAGGPPALGGFPAPPGVGATLSGPGLPLAPPGVGRNPGGPAGPGVSLAPRGVGTTFSGQDVQAGRLHNGNAGGPAGPGGLSAPPGVGAALSGQGTQASGPHNGNAGGPGGPGGPSAPPGVGAALSGQGAQAGGPHNASAGGPAGPGGSSAPPGVGAALSGQGAQASGPHNASAGGPPGPGGSSPPGVGSGVASQRQAELGGVRSQAELGNETLPAEGLPAEPGFRPIPVPLGPGERTPVGPRPPSVGRVLGNRDFILHVECVERGVIVTPPGKAFDFRQPQALEQVVALVRTLVQRRQATVRAGEPPYRPSLVFRVTPDGRRNYHVVWPLLAELGHPMSRESTD